MYRLREACSILTAFVIGSTAPDELSISDTPVAWNGEHHVITWAAGPQDKRAIYAARVSASGSVVDAPPIVVSALGEPTAGRGFDR